MLRSTWPELIAVGREDRHDTLEEVKRVNEIHSATHSYLNNYLEWIRDLKSSYTETKLL